jgi:hypothetical protein
MTRPPRRNGRGPRTPTGSPAPSPSRPPAAATPGVAEAGSAVPPETKAARLVEAVEREAVTAGPAATARSTTIGPRVATPVGGIRVDPTLPPILPGTDPGPLLLLPLRLEYRLVTRGRPPIVADLSTDLAALSAIDGRPGRSAASRTARGTERRAAVSAILRKEAPTARLVLAGTRELWFRWYPDESFARKGIEPPTASEAAALAALRRQRIGRLRHRHRERHPAERRRGPK